MSADNQAEPAAAMAAAAPSAAASAAPASEYLKRTCLICGCQTNQTINIYEPRSGPNIVQLIQAKFKFQPLNEDKFLCFSCNNWLINWHSLQALNSNDAESRSQSPSHLGNNSSAGALVQQKGQPLERAKLRPVAQVRPQPQAQILAPKPAAPQSATAPTPAISYSKRRFGGRTASVAHSTRKMLRHCNGCGTAMVLRLLSSTRTQTLAKLARRRTRSQCRRCRESEISKWRRLHRRSLLKVEQLQRAMKNEQEQQQEQPLAGKDKALVKTLATPTYQRLPAPRVDGKVVAMFRRLGTTLSREQREQQELEPTPSMRPVRIMSPAKQRPRWTRDLDEDEILLEFDSVITEVLPAAPAARRRLRYQLTNDAEAEEEVERNRKVTHHMGVQLTGLQLPQGLSITLI